jgi:hypothetical protein
VGLDDCHAQGLTPDARVLSFHETFEAKRADLKLLNTPP